MLLIERKQYPFFFIFLLSLIILLIWCILSQKWGYILCLLGFFIGIGRVLFYPIVQEEKYMIETPPTHVVGTVDSIKYTEFNQQVILRNIEFEDRKIKSYILLKVPLEQQLQIEDRVLCKGEWNPLKDPMNPSDFNFRIYMQGQGVSGEFTSEFIEVIDSKNRILPQIRESLSRRIDRLFGMRDEGLMKGLLLGDLKDQNKEVMEMYYDLGAGHIWSISGFHIAIVAGGIWLVLGEMNISYIKRHLCVIGSIWGYGILVGLGVSTVRACIIVTLVGLGRCLYEEDDLLTSLGIGAILILGNNPFVLLQVSFQLSFGAMIGVVVAMALIHKTKLKRKLTWLSEQVMGTLLISVILMPILSYHFFKVSLLGIIFNVLSVPIFGIILPAGLILLGISYICFPVAYGIGYTITYLLDCLNHLAYLFDSLPYAVIYTGRPHLADLLLYYSIVSLGLWIYCRWLDNPKAITYRHFFGGCSVGLLIISIYSFDLKFALDDVQVMQLYIGQGDSAVITTPHQRTLLVDSGKRGKGSVIKQYLHYRGTNRVDLIILSHGHDDHIGGVFDLIEEEVEIGGIVFGLQEEKEPMQSELMRLCMEKSIPVYEIGEEKVINIDGVHLKLSPMPDLEDLNEGSLICQLTYGKYDHLFTGDIGFEREAKLSEVKNIDVLKVAHHGSKNGTSEEFLLQTQPKYGIISCGINNQYQHPHQDAIKRLDQFGVSVFSTHEAGGILLATDGEYLKISNQLQKEPIVYEGD